ncbi:MAG: hypothetical protein OEY59_07940, partial [Deltaproteobacteria bacterium]|nr:hypothetical protein [Deltaproteobacteria bacterium]
VTGLALSLSGESWSSPNYQGNAGGFELEYGADRIKRSLRVSAGSYYSLYKYDYYLDYGERTKVRTYFVKTRIPLGENYSLTGSFETEDQIEEYQILKMGVKRDF